MVVSSGLLESPKRLVLLRRVLVKCFRAHNAPEINMLSISLTLQSDSSVCQSVKRALLAAREIEVNILADGQT